MHTFREKNHKKTADSSAAWSQVAADIHRQLLLQVHQFLRNLGLLTKAVYFAATPFTGIKKKPTGVIQYT